MPITELYMRMRPIHSAAVAFVAALAVTVGSPGPAEAFLPLPIPILPSPGRISLNAQVPCAPFALFSPQDSLPA